MKGYLVLENGEIFEGEQIGYNKKCICEVVFNTSMAGYLEIFTDPSYCGQGMCMTYPLIGNYGHIREDYESQKMWVEAVFLHQLAPLESNFRSEANLNEFLIKNQIPGLKKINTRKLTKILREFGTMRGMVTDDISNLDKIIKEIKEYNNNCLVSKTTSDKIYKVGEGDIKIALLDFGAKQNIIRSLLKRGCSVTVFPEKSKEINPKNFDGIVLSNGPGDPAECIEAIETIKDLYKSDTPILRNMFRTSINGTCNRSKNSEIKIWTSWTKSTSKRYKIR